MFEHKTRNGSIFCSCCCCCSFFSSSKIVSMQIVDAKCVIAHRCRYVFTYFYLAVKHFHVRLNDSFVDCSRKQQIKCFCTFNFMRMLWTAFFVHCVEILLPKKGIDHDPFWNDPDEGSGTKRVTESPKLSPLRSNINRMAKI